MATIALVCRDV